MIIPRVRGSDQIYRLRVVLIDGVNRRVHMHNTVIMGGMKCRMWVITTIRPHLSDAARRNDWFPEPTQTIENTGPRFILSLHDATEGTNWMFSILMMYWK